MGKFIMAINVHMHKTYVNFAEMAPLGTFRPPEEVKTKHTNGVHKKFLTVC